MRPKMVVIAGPIASGKTSVFRRVARDTGIDSFNVDDRCAELNNGSYQRLPVEVVQQATKECEDFIREHTAQGRSFMVETTLRSPVAIEQAAAARRAGFTTRMVYVATDDCDVNVARARARCAGGGRDMTEETVRDTYQSSLAQLPRAMREFDRVDLYDNTPTAQDATFQARTEYGELVARTDEPKTWVHEVCRDTEFERQLERCPTRAPTIER